MRRRKFGLLLLAGCLFMNAGCAETRVSGRTAHETFDDPRVAALVETVSRGDFAEADKAVRAGADVNAISPQGLTPLLWVMGTTLNVSRIEYLLKAGANPNYRVAGRLASPMYLASGGDRPDILELLLKYKGDPNLIGPNGESMLSVALAQFRKENLDILIKYGADINRADKNGYTAANDAAAYGRFDWVAMFLDLGLNQNIQRLARSVDMRLVPPDSDQQRWKNKVVEMLKARGAKFPAFIPHKEPEG